MAVVDSSLNIVALTACAWPMRPSCRQWSAPSTNAAVIMISEKGIGSHLGRSHDATAERPEPECPFVHGVEVKVITQHGNRRQKPLLPISCRAKLEDVAALATGFPLATASRAA